MLGTAVNDKASQEVTRVSIGFGCLHMLSLGGGLYRPRPVTRFVRNKSKCARTSSRFETQQLGYPTY
jgi:hypothetical protein